MILISELRCSKGWRRKGIIENSGCDGQRSHLSTDVSKLSCRIHWLTMKANSIVTSGNFRGPHDIDTDQIARRKGGAIAIIDSKFVK